MNHKENERKPEAYTAEQVLEISRFFSNIAKDYTDIAHKMRERGIESILIPSPSNLKVSREKIIKHVSHANSALYASSGD